MLKTCWQRRRDTCLYRRELPGQTLVVHTHSYQGVISDTGVSRLQHHHLQGSGTRQNPLMLDDWESEADVTRIVLDPLELR